MDIVAAKPRGTVVRWAGDGSWTPRPPVVSSVAGYSEMGLHVRRGGDLFWRCACPDLREIEHACFPARAIGTALG